MASFTDAVKGLPHDDKTRVNTVLTQWAQAPTQTLQRIAHNIRNETALGLAEFQQLLATFASELAPNTKPLDAWVRACRTSKLVGAPVSNAARPGVIGRALTLGTYAGYLVEDAGFTLRDAKDYLRQVILNQGTLKPEQLRTLERTRVGRYIVWTTFDHDNPTDHPFGKNPPTHEYIRTSYGLGHCDRKIQLIVLAYRPNIELRRPTVADAEDNEWYHPHSNPSAPYGWTKPLDPNTSGYPPQPELVHKQTQAGSLVLPIYATV